MPLMSGSTQSTRTRSGRPPVPSSIACAPLAASSTSWPCSRHTSAIRVLTSGSSSMTRMRCLRRPGSGGQLCAGGANPTLRDSRAERFERLIRRTRFSPPSITSASSQPSAAEVCRNFDQGRAVGHLRHRQDLGRVLPFAGGEADRRHVAGRRHAISGLLGLVGVVVGIFFVAHWHSETIVGCPAVPPAGVEPALDRV